MVDVSLQRQIVVNHDAEVTDVRSRLDGYPRDVEFTNRAVLQPPRGSKPDQLRLWRVEFESIAAHPFVDLGDTVRHSHHQTWTRGLRWVVVDLEVVGIGVSSKSMFFQLCWWPRPRREWRVLDQAPIPVARRREWRQFLMSARCNEHRLFGWLGRIWTNLERNRSVHTHSAVCLKKIWWSTVSNAALRSSSPSNDTIFSSAAA